jgi:hypothetical protein
MEPMIRSLALAALLLAAPAAADPAADVLAAANTLLAAVNSNDAEALGRIMLPGATLVSQRYAADGALQSHTLTLADMQASLRANSRHFDERLQGPTVLVQRDLAQVWSRYTFDVDGKRQHCGVDSFSLVRIEGVWRVSHLAWTAEPQGCPQ